MTDEERRVKIAEADGWTEIHKRNCQHLCKEDLCGVKNGKKDGWPWLDGHNVLPEYLSDLNAMREVENTLTPSQTIDFTGHLEKIVTSPHGYFSNWFMIHATARQRAEAFLRTVKPELF